MAIPKTKEPMYSGLPIVYLDQNILTGLRDNKLITLKDALKHQFQAVYSNETLEEIKRAGVASSAFSTAFLNVLAEINAAHISIVLDDNFHDTEQVRIALGDPHAVFQQYCDPQPAFDGIAESLKQLGFKTAGGRQGETIDDVAQDGIQAFENLMDYLEEQISEIEEEFPEAVELMRQEKAQYLEKFKALSKQNSQTMSAQIADERNWSGIRDFRQHFQLEPYHFNNIQPPNVLEQVWMIMQSSKEMPEGFDSIDDFFVFNKTELMPGVPFCRHHKVLGAYNMLNTIGYYPDTPLHKDRGFKRATSDQMHASIASYCNGLVTADKRFFKKVEAIYEYLEIPTEIIYLGK